MIFCLRDFFTLEVILKIYCFDLNKEQVIVFGNEKSGAKG